jgi:hypothetical protein
MKEGDILVCTKEFEGFPNISYKKKYKYLEKIEINNRILYLVEDLRTNLPLYGFKYQFITLRAYRDFKLKQIEN